MNIFAGSIEIQMLCWAVVLGLAQLIVATALATRDQGLAYNMSARDLPAPSVSPLSARMLRAFANFRETFPFFVAAVLVAYLGGRLGALTAAGTALYVGARAVYVFLYAFGVPVVRSLVWVASMAGLGLVLLALVI